MTSVTRGDTFRATLWGLACAFLLIAGIWFGSRSLRDFDPALVPYAGASVFAAFGIGYRYSMWLRRPPTRLYWYRGWQVFLRPRALPRNLVHWAGLLWNNILLQRFIGRRSRTRWAAHWFIFWGCIIAALVTFPLSFGWIRFENAPGDQHVYTAFLWGIRVFRFTLHTLGAHVIFNILDIAAALVLIGIGFSLWRRSRDRGALAVQQFSADLLPLVLLFSISITGLFLTASTHFLAGSHYLFLSQLHAVTVIGTLLYLPFGKFFHIFQRPAQLGVDFYREQGKHGEQARCARCGKFFAARMHVDDLKQVQGALAIKYQLADGTHYQDYCPVCRRKNLGLVQDALWRAAGRGPVEGF